MPNSTFSPAVAVVTGSTRGLGLAMARLVTSDRAEFRALTGMTIVTRGVRNVLAGRLRRRNRMPMDITVLDADG